MVHIVRLVRNGNSTTAAIPPAVLTELAWHRGDVLACGIEEDRVVLRRVADRELLSAAPAAPATRPARRRRA